MFAASKTTTAAPALVPVYIEDVYSTFLYTGNGSTQTITNGIDLAGKGGLVWLKGRSNTTDNLLFDTQRGSNALISNATNAQMALAGGGLTAYNANGFTLGSGAGYNQNGWTFASWTFREQPKFFDVVTYTGNGALPNQLISHNLGSVPGCIIIKATNASRNWIVWHRGDGTTNYTGFSLNLTSASAASVASGDLPTATQFKPAAFFDPDYNGANETGVTYVAYLFAHNAGGFGLTGTDNVISCGSYTGNGSTTGPSINLGWEPQWIITKDATSASSWSIFDTMRGFNVGTSGPQIVFANTSGAEVDFGGAFGITSTGFKVLSDASSINTSGNTYIYIAIRRGPMKTPTSGTSVYYGLSRSGTGAAANITGCPFVPDLVMAESRNVSVMTSGASAATRLQGSYYLTTASTAAEISSPANSFSSWLMNGYSVGGGASAWNDSSAGTVYMNWMIGRAPGFCDVVCYTGTGANTTQTHNLSVVPELMIVKRRDTTGPWQVYSAAVANTEYLVLNTTAAKATGTTRWNSTTPTASVFTIGTDASVNASGGTYVAYLFASCPGVSKVGSYTGNGSTQTINCGFTGGARFVLIKRTDSTGGWYVYDTARGMTTLTDPYLFLNSTAAESATLGSVTTVTTGFALNAAILSAVNTNAASYIYLAIA